MQDLKERLLGLRKRKEALSYIVKNSFDTIEKFDAFKAENAEGFEELKNINDEIRELEWQLMSPKERQELLDYYEKIKEKYSDD